MYLHTAQEFIEHRAIAHPILGFLSWYFQSWTSLKYYTNLRLLSHKNVTFTLQVMKNQANILFPSKYHFPVSIFTADKSSDFWVQSVLIKTLMRKQAKKM